MPANFHLDLVAFAQDHLPEITGTVGLVSYALLRNKLTPAGIFAGILVAGIHTLHPWRAFFWLLIVFFLVGTLVTRIGHKAKVHLTQSATGGSGGEGPRSSAQVFANSGTACILIALHSYLLHGSSKPFISSFLPLAAGPSFPILQGLLPIGIIAQYAAVAADTFSSELGILARTTPFLITAPWRRVPRGTNGGVTLEGLLYGLVGSVLLVGVAQLALSLSPYATAAKATLSPSTIWLLSLAGLAGSVIDSVLGALVQTTVTDRTTGKVVEGAGGTRVKVAEGGSRAKSGRDLLTNNGVNFAMAAITSGLAMGVAYALGLHVGL
ncbi:uncharacterized protein K489DRAFT_359595 [Dissoconium aciculare CBS 342.82]|uniref:DUF92-domain-containing protein n=1 Tax=Dissoconium aciculare CBS 342.82 TaxID=1314786 RepID=A0A6J3M4A8_9PEZI|nr:uncharacterized protein K489DRAFT_359595 [Dissoconium aciculare CBS 342.82]KAF1821747.1 hypothetical protein K489DRAFT_359595 [Dissoconium aciculare CBS 342.82]